MYGSILLPVDGSQGAASVRSHATAIARWADATVDVLYVLDTAQYSVGAVEAAPGSVLSDHGEGVVDAAADALADAGVTARTHVASGSASREIVAFAEREGSDLVVMPTHGRTGLSRYVLGSVTETVVRNATAPVLSARMTDDERLTFPYEAILVPTDGSHAATAAAEHAIDLAAALDATVHVLSVVPTASLGSDVRSAHSTPAVEALTEEAVADVVDRVESRGLPVETTIARGDPSEAITGYAADGDVDAIVMGTTGRRGVDRLLLGSVAESTVRRSPVPVLTIGAHED